MKVVIASLRPSYFNASGLAGAIKRYCGADVTHLTAYPRAFENVYFWPMLDKTYMYMFETDKSVKAIEESDLLIICGLSFISSLFLKRTEELNLDKITSAVKNARKIMIVSDSDVFDNPRDRHLREWEYEQIYALPSLFPYLNCFAKPAFQANWYYANPRKINGEIVIGHSPGIKRVTDRKGTKAIQEVVESLGHKLRIIENMTYKNCIKAKTEMDIFIEQQPNIEANKSLLPNSLPMWPYYGSLGKSGQEGMCNGCATITSGIFHDTKDYFPFPPVIIANTKEELRVELQRLLSDREHLKNVQDVQNKWAKKYLHPSYVANYLMKDYLGKN